MQTVSELDEDDSDVVSQRDEHFSNIGSLDIDFGIINNIIKAQIELSDAVNEAADDRSELLRDHSVIDDRIFDRVVKERCLDRSGVNLKVSKDQCNSDRVRNIGLARLTLLVAVRLECEDKCLLHLGIVLFDILLIEICGSCVLVVELQYFLEFLFQFRRDLGLYTVVLKISAFGLSLHFLFGYGIKFFVILALSHLVFSYKPQNH